MPVHQFVPEPPLVERGLTNYWGYNTIGFFAPHHGYVRGDRRRTARSPSSRRWSRRCTRPGIEVILDVVYNHTAEGDRARARRCRFRGIDNAAYYRLADDDPARLPGLHRLRQHASTSGTRTRCS